jgi:hypothetical protein
VKRRGRKLSVETRGLDQLDVYVDGHPAGTSIKLRGNGARSFAVPSVASSVEVVGFASGVIRQRRRLMLAGRS